MANFGEMATVGAAVKEDCDFNEAGTKLGDGPEGWKKCLAVSTTFIFCSCSGCGMNDERGKVIFFRRVEAINQLGWAPRVESQRVQPNVAL